MNIERTEKLNENSSFSSEYDTSIKIPLLNLYRTNNINNMFIY